VRKGRLILGFDPRRGRVVPSFDLVSLPQGMDCEEETKSNEERPVQLAVQGSGS